MGEHSAYVIRNPPDHWRQCVDKHVANVNMAACKGLSYVYQCVACPHTLVVAKIRKVDSRNHKTLLDAKVIAVSSGVSQWNDGHTVKRFLWAET